MVDTEQLLAHVLAAKEAEQRLRDAVEAFLHVGFPAELAARHPWPEFGKRLTRSMQIVEHQEALHACPAIDQVHQVARSGRRLLRVVTRDLPAEHHTAPLRDGADHRFEVGAADVVEGDVDAGRAERCQALREPLVAVESWKVDLLDTGATTHTGGRVRQMCEYVGPGTIMMTYGDGLSDVNITKLLAFHRAHGKLATMTAVTPPARFGALQFDGDVVHSFQEKPLGGEGWINGGFFVLDTRVASEIHDDETPFEQDPLYKLARDGQLMGFKHNGFWQCMDTVRDLRLLEQMWSSGEAPWKMRKGLTIEVEATDEPKVLGGKESCSNRAHRI